MPSIGADTIRDALSIQIDPTIHFISLGLVNAVEMNTLSFIDDLKYMDQLNINKNITGVFVSNELSSKVNCQKYKIIVDDPRYSFYQLSNFVGRKFYERWATKIANPSIIHETAYICDQNVIIGKNAYIEPNVTILADTEIGENVIIRAGSVIGAEGFEHKRTSKGLLSVFHDGKVFIGNDVEIGANNAISKGMSYRHTIIGDQTKTDNLVHIAHCVHIGKRCLFPACCMIAGSVTIGDDVWIGPNASISSQITISDGAFITLGSVVTKDVQENQRLTGNFAIPHHLFISNLKKKTKEE